MKKFKKAALTAASYVSVAALAIGGTMAYFSYETNTAVNTRTVGSVEITQHEYQRADGVSHINTGAKKGDLEAFEQGQMILPAVPLNSLGSDYSAEQSNDRQFWWGEYTNNNGSNGLWDDTKLSNVMDKFVFVENTGDVEAFYRTVIAFECPEGATYGEASNGADFMCNANLNWRFDWSDEQYITVDDTRYMVMSATYNMPLAPGEVSRPSLLQVVMTHHADNELAEALGDTYDILVISQAINADTNVANIEDNEIRSEKINEMLDTAFGDITETWADDNSVKDSDFIATSGEHTLKRDIILADNGNATDCVTADGADTIVNITGGTYDSANKDCAVWAKNGATVNIYDGTFTCGAIDGEVTSNNHSDLIYAGANGGKINIYGGTFSTATPGDWVLNEKDGQGTITVYGGTFKEFNPADNVAEGAGTNFVAPGYKVVEEVIDGVTWYTVVAE